MHRSCKPNTRGLLNNCNHRRSILQFVHDNSRFVHCYLFTIGSPEFTQPNHTHIHGVLFEEKGGGRGCLFVCLFLVFFFCWGSYCSNISYLCSVLQITACLFLSLFFWPLQCLSFDLWLLTTALLFSNPSLVFSILSFGHCIHCLSFFDSWFMITL